MEPDRAREWLREKQGPGTSCNEALSFFDALPEVPVAQMIGRWKGSGLKTGHPMDGLLEALRWHGKEFVDPDCVHPLLFEGRRGLVALSPRHLPLHLAAHHTQGGSLLERVGFALVRPLLVTSKPQARLRRMEHRGICTATMIYDSLPIHDVFRKVDEDTVLGLMDLRGWPQPFFFVLRRD